MFVRCVSYNYVDWLKRLVPYLWSFAVEPLIISVFHGIYICEFHIPAVLWETLKSWLFPIGDGVSAKCASCSAWFYLLNVYMLKVVWGPLDANIYHL